MIHFEPKIYSVRGGVNFKEYGDPYDFCLQVFIDGDSAYIYGLCGKFTHRDYSQIRKHLISIGIKTVHWERKKSDGDKKIIVDLSKGK